MGDAAEPSGADDAEDQLEIDAVNAAVERNVLAPLRVRGVCVPRGELSRRDAWRLAQTRRASHPRWRASMTSESKERRILCRVCWPVQNGTPRIARM